MSSPDLAAGGRLDVAGARVTASSATGGADGVGRGTATGGRLAIVNRIMWLQAWQRTWYTRPSRSSCFVEYTEPQRSHLNVTRHP